MTRTTRMSRMRMRGKKQQRRRGLAGKAAAVVGAAAAVGAITVAARGRSHARSDKAGTSETDTTPPVS